MKILKLFIKIFCLYLCFFTTFVVKISLAEENKKISHPQLFDSNSKEPTIITSNQLELNSEDRTFRYFGKVTVKNAETTLTCDSLAGNYSLDHKLENLVATKDVVIIKGTEMQAKSQKATFDNANQIVVLSENPELIQNQSQLNADIITIFLKENRSSAQGNVRVKIIQDEKKTKYKSE